MLCDTVATEQCGGIARLKVGSRIVEMPGRWVIGGPWERFGKYDSYVAVRHDGETKTIPAHAGELVPGTTEDLEAVLRTYDPAAGRPPCPMTLELDPTYVCTSRDCGGRCFSAAYRRLSPRAQIPAPLLVQLVRTFAAEGGRVLRLDGGGDPLSHASVRSGELIELAYNLGLKSTVLTSGDLLPQTDLHRIGLANCYVRISLNAATNATRSGFHGNSVRLTDIFATVERFAAWLENANPDLPIGATFLLDVANAHELFDCARIARAIGIRHFSVRRVLGPPWLRAHFSKDQLDVLQSEFARVRELSSDRFRVFLPWRSPNEPDLIPAKGDLSAFSCWQSTFRTVVEPDPEGLGFRMQLCGRYRGSGVGQCMQMPPIASSADGSEWVDLWRRSFADYGTSRRHLPRTCLSCIDRGFIAMLDRLLEFLQHPSRGFRLLHLFRNLREAPESFTR